MTALVYTIRTRHIRGGNPSTYVVHDAGCSHVGRNPQTNFGRIPRIDTKIRVGSVRGCKFCNPNLDSLRTEA